MAFVINGYGKIEMRGKAWQIFSFAAKPIKGIRPFFLQKQKHYVPDGKRSKSHLYRQSAFSAFASVEMKK